MRFASQLLTGPPATSVEEVVTRLLAVQAQDARGFRLAIRSRSTGLVAADVDRALTESRSLVVTWLNRGTLHLVPATDYWWLHPLTTPQLATASRRRLQQEGVSEAQARRGIEVVTDAVRTGPQTRTQLRQHLHEAGVPTDGQALVQVLLAASLHADVVRGPVIGTEQAFVSAAGWIGAPPPAVDRTEALARLARRYLAGHAPAEAADLARWAGIPLGDARRAMDAIGDETTPHGEGLVLVDQPRVDGVPSPTLLGPFDPLLLGWVSRAPFVGRHTGVVTTNGIFRAVALVGGRVTATWGLSGGVLTIGALEPMSAAVERALEQDGADVRRFLGTG